MIRSDVRSLELGAIPRLDGSATFFVWAPKSQSVDLHLVSPSDQLIPMKRLERGYWTAKVPEVAAGSRYYFRHDGQRDLPDPASRSQPDGVHKASEVIDPDKFSWSSDLWRAPAIDDYVIYEIHVGTFTPEGTFEAAIVELDRLVELGVTAVELMPVAEFPGARNWGYDGAYPFAAESAYGGPTGLAKLIDACHERNLAVVLDVVYNHFGPEGSYQAAAGNYLTDRYHTAWGAAINLDGPDSDEVRRYFIESARYWLTVLRVDAFRLDAVHAIFDQSAYPFLSQFTDELHRFARELGRTVYLIAESDLNDPRMVRSSDLGGFGFDAQWSDDLHHALHARVTGERSGYYVDFGSVQDIRRAYQHGYVFTGQYSDYRRRAHGLTPSLVEPSRFVVCSQNHDQVGNRAIGDRLAAHLSFEQLKLMAASVILSPFIPMLFMGEEYGESAPFQYFTSHGDPDLIDAVRAGRTEEFRDFAWAGSVPDPQDPSTFNRSKLQAELRNTSGGANLEAFYHELIQIRREDRALRRPSFLRQQIDLAGEDGSVLVARRWFERDQTLIMFNFADRDQLVRMPGDNLRWSTVLDSAESEWNGSDGSIGPVQLQSGARISIRAWSAVVFESIPSETTI